MPSRYGGPHRGWAAAAASLAFLVLGSRPAPAEIAERILAVVDGRPVTLSEVRFFARVRGEDEARALEALIDERLMDKEASRLAPSAVTRDEEARALESIKSRIDTARIPEDELLRIVRREVAILKYVEFRFRPQVRVAADAVRQEYERRRADPDPPAFEDVSEDLRRTLADREMGIMIEAWIKDLRSGADIRYNR